MNIVVVCASVFRVLGVWMTLLTVQWLVSAVLAILEHGLSPSGPMIAEVIWQSLVAGAMLTFAPELANWVAGKGRPFLETGLKMGASCFFFAKSHVAVGVFFQWLTHARHLEEPTFFVNRGFEKEHVVVAVGSVLFALVVMSLARPVGRWVAFNERMRELRQSE